MCLCANSNNVMSGAFCCGSECGFTKTFTIHCMGLGFRTGPAAAALDACVCVYWTAVELTASLAKSNRFDSK